MKTLSLKQILLDEINQTNGWLTKGQLGMVAEHEGYLPESVGRELRSMAEDRPDHKPEILVSYYQGKRKQQLSRYAKLSETVPVVKVKRYVVDDGVAREIYV